MNSSLVGQWLLRASFSHIYAETVETVRGLSVTASQLLTVVQIEKQEVNIIFSLHYGLAYMWGSSFQVGGHDLMWHNESFYWKSFLIH